MFELQSGGFLLLGSPYEQVRSFVDFLTTLKYLRFCFSALFPLHKLILSKEIFSLFLAFLISLLLFPSSFCSYIVTG